MFQRGRRRRSSGGRGYTTEFKLKVVEQVVHKRVSVDRASQVFGVAKSTLAGWVRRYDADGPDGLRPTPKAKPVREVNGRATRGHSAAEGRASGVRDAGGSGTCWSGLRGLA